MEATQADTRDRHPPRSGRIYLAKTVVASAAWLALLALACGHGLPNNKPPRPMMVGTVEVDPQDGTGCAAPTSGEYEVWLYWDQGGDGGCLTNPDTTTEDPIEKVNVSTSSGSEGEYTIPSHSGDANPRDPPDQYCVVLMAKVGGNWTVVKVNPSAVPADRAQTAAVTVPQFCGP